MKHTRENGAHCVMAHEKPVVLIRIVAPVTESVSLSMQHRGSIKAEQREKERTGYPAGTSPIQGD